MIDEIELESRLRTALREVIPTLIESAHIDGLDDGLIDLDTPTHSRGRRVAMTALASAAAIAAIALVIVWPRSDQPLDPVQDSSPVSTEATDTIATPSTPTTTVTPVSTAPLATDAPDTTVGVPGSQAGLYIPPAQLPPGWTVVYAGEWPASTPAGTASSTFAARYSSDRSTVESSLQLSIDSGDPADGVEGADVTVRGVDGALAPGQLVWTENGRTVTLAGSPELDLIAIADTLATSPDGPAFDALPDGFELVGTTATAAAEPGPTHYTRYANDQSIDPDRDIVLSVLRTTRPTITAEMTFVESSRRTPSADSFAADVAGRRVIIDPGYVVTASWDDPNGTRVDIEYAPLDGGTTSQQRVDQAVTLIAALHPADTDTWDQIVAEAPDNLGRVRDRTFIAAELDKLGLTASGPERQIPIQRAGPPRAFLVVPVNDGNGAPAGTCEFLLRRLVTCTDPAAMATTPPDSAVTTLLDDGYIRIIVGSDIATIELRSTVPGGSSHGPPTPLDTDAPSPRIAYIVARADPSTSCIALFDDRAQPITPSSPPSATAAIPNCAP